MKYLSPILLLTLSIFLVNCANEREATETETVDSEHQILIFSKTEGWRHDSIEAGHKAITSLATDNDISVTSTEDASYFTTENLREYDAVVFLNTTETIFDDHQREAFRSYIQSGGGFVGIH